MRSAIDTLAGLSPLRESTMTTSMPMTAAPATMQVRPAATEPAKKKKPKLSDLLMKKQQQQEVAEKPVIPGDAQPDDTLNGVPNENGKEHPPAGRGTLEAPLPTSLALVAPDTTPNAEAPLDPSQVPQPASSVEPSMSSPTPIDSGNDVLRTLVGEHQKNFNPKLITDPTAAAAAVNQFLNGNGSSEEKSSTASAAAARVMSEAQSGKKPEPHHNPDSLNRGIAVTRQILGM